MRVGLLLLRSLLVLAGGVMCAIAVSAGSKLFRDSLDSPRWMIGGLAVLSLTVGIGLIGVAIRLRRPRPAS